MQKRSLSAFACAFLAGSAMLVAGRVAAAPPQAPSQGPAVTDASAASTIREGSGTDPAQSRNAARSRMRECGHQWSAMKKNGSANGMTWKDFSQGCLAKP